MTDSDDRAGSQPSDWEQRLIEHGTPIEEQDFGDAVEAEVSGCLLGRQLEDGNQFRVVARADLAGLEREDFAEWACERLLRFATRATGVAAVGALTPIRSFRRLGGAGMS